VLLYELLFGLNGSIRGGGQVKRHIIKYEAELQAAKEIVVEKSAVVTDVPVFPRYVRINTLLTKAPADMVAALSKEHSTMYRDAHVPNMMVLPPSTPLFDNDLINTGKLVLQDKSSCFSALALVHGSTGPNDHNCDYMDACAAPGNKTTHLAALINEQLLLKNKVTRKSQVFALDRAENRIGILKKRLRTLLPPPDDTSTEVTVEAIHEDFLKVDPSDKTYKNLGAILLDPSCSGSGVVNTIDRHGDVDKNSTKEDQRVEALSNFQLVALKHAMSFPQVKRIVYSTCSIHDRENEEVVAMALKEYASENTKNDPWTIVAPHCLQDWSRRGHVGAGGLSEEQSKCLIRVDGLNGDETNGFFVCYLERRSLAEKSDSLPKKAAIAVSQRLDLPLYEGQFKQAPPKPTKPKPTKKATSVPIEKKVESPVAPSTKNEKKPEQKVYGKRNKAKAQAQAKELDTNLNKDHTHVVNKSDKAKERPKRKGTDPSKFIKKREKKLAWKLKQKEMKDKRVEKKSKPAEEKET
jgi:putative methyltransferase